MSHRTHEQSLWDLISKRYPAPSYTSSKVPDPHPSDTPGTVSPAAPEGEPSEESFLVEALRLFDAEVVKSLSSEEAERQWQERRAGPARSYLHPWPDVLPGLGPRMVGPFIACEDCGTGSWARYGGRALCLPCARQCR